MRGNLVRALRQSMLRGACVAGAGFGLALVPGAGGLMLAGGPVTALVDTVASALPAAPAELRPASVPTRAIADDAVSVVRVNEQALEASRMVMVGEAEMRATLAVAALPVATAVATPAADVMEAPPLVPGDLAQATLSFYYCEQGAGGLHAGDGGGFCGIMRDGTVVYEGAAACDHAYLGQQFRILGDPLERIYRCADTGSAVHGLHRDIWFHDSDEGWAWQRVLGQNVLIEILP